MKNISTPTYEECAGMVYCPRGVKWLNTGEMIPVEEAIALGATNIRESEGVETVGLIADWPAFYWE